MTIKMDYGFTGCGKLGIWGEMGESIPQGLKPSSILLHLYRD
jgi:hypothetical protein